MKLKTLESWTLCAIIDYNLKNMRGRLLLSSLKGKNCVNFYELVFGIAESN